MGEGWDGKGNVHGIGNDNVHDNVNHNVSDNVNDNDKGNDKGNGNDTNYTVPSPLSPSTCKLSLGTCHCFHFSML